MASLTRELSAESQKRISAELKSEEAENKLREAEGTLAAMRSSGQRKLKEENEELCERLAFVEDELITDRERHRVIVEELKGDVAVIRARLNDKESELEKIKRDLDGAVEKPESVFDDQEIVAEEELAQPPTAVDNKEDYIITLEMELELVTEQLIEAETKLSKKDSELEDALVQIDQAYNTPKDGINNESSGKGFAAVTESDLNIKNLDVEKTTLQKEAKRLKEELELALEELALSKEEIEAHEEDRKQQTIEFDLERKRHKEEISRTRIHLNKISSEEQSNVNREKVEMKERHQVLEEIVEEQSIEVKNLSAANNQLNFQVENLTKLLCNTEQKLKKQQTEVKNHQKSAAPALVANPKELQDAQDEIHTLEGLLEAAKKELEVQRREIKKILQEKTVHTQKEEKTSQDELAKTHFNLIDVEKNPRTQHKLLSATAHIELKRKKKVARLSISQLPLRRLERDREDDEFPLYSHKLSNRPRSCSPTSIERIKADATYQAVTASSLQSKCSRLEDQNRMGVSMKRKLEDEIKQLRKQVGSDASEENEDPVQYLMETDEIEKILQTNDLELIGEEIRSMAKKISSLKSHNAELLTKILKLQGNIQVRICAITQLLYGVIYILIHL